jgi:hypothetical protein
MSSELVNALVNDLPMVKSLHKKISKLEKRNMKLKIKKNMWKDKYHAIMAILHDYPGITYSGDVTSTKRRRDVVDLTEDDESITLDVDNITDLKNSIMDFTRSLSIVKTEHPRDLCKNKDCVGSDPDGSLSKCSLCQGYYKDDGLNDILFIEKEPNNRNATCELCNKTTDIVQMKGTGKYICQNTAIVGVNEDCEVVEEEHRDEHQLCVNENCVIDNVDGTLEKCKICDGYYKDDGLNDILFIEEEPNNRKAYCELCKKSVDIVQMKGTGQYICQNACDDDEEEDEEKEDGDFTCGSCGTNFDCKIKKTEYKDNSPDDECSFCGTKFDNKWAEQYKSVNENETSLTYNAEEEGEEEEEEVVEEEEEEEEGEEEEEEAVYEVEIKGKKYYTTDEKNGDVYSITEDEDIGDCVGKFVNGKFKKNK